METYDIKTGIYGFWIDTLKEEIEPLVRGVTFSLYNNNDRWPYQELILIHVDKNEITDKEWFLAGLKGMDIFDKGVFETALKNFVRERIGHKI